MLFSVLIKPFLFFSLFNLLNIIYLYVQKHLYEKEEHSSTDGQGEEHRKKPRLCSRKQSEKEMGIDNRNPHSHSSCWTTVKHAELEAHRGAIHHNLLLVGVEGKTKPTLGLIGWPWVVFLMSCFILFAFCLIVGVFGCFLFRFFCLFLG